MPAEPVAICSWLREAQIGSVYGSQHCIYRSHVLTSNNALTTAGPRTGQRVHHLEFTISCLGARQYGGGLCACTPNSVGISVLPIPKLLDCK